MWKGARDGPPGLELGGGGAAAGEPFLLAVISAVLLFGGVCWSAPSATPVVAQTHVISVHVQDPATFDAVYLFLRDVLQLPRVYGELSKPGNDEKRFYAGFSAGNAYLEPCGPYKDDAPFSPDQRARFHGLTFSPATNIAVSEKELALRSIPHSDVMAGGEFPRFVYVTDGLLTSEKLAVSLWEIQDPKHHANLQFLESSLQDAKGGALGVQGIEEVRIEIPEPANLTQWGSFLSPSKHERDRWLIGKGPALRFVSGDSLQIQSIVLRVESLKRAKFVLSQRGLVGRLKPGSVELDTTKTWGLRIILREK